MAAEVGTIGRQNMSICYLIVYNKTFLGSANEYLTVRLWQFARPITGVSIEKPYSLRLVNCKSHIIQEVNTTDYLVTVSLAKGWGLHQSAIPLHCKSIMPNRFPLPLGQLRPFGAYLQKNWGCSWGLAWSLDKRLNLCLISTQNIIPDVLGTIKIFLANQRRAFWSAVTKA